VRATDTSTELLAESVSSALTRFRCRHASRDRHRERSCDQQSREERKRRREGWCEAGEHPVLCRIKNGSVDAFLPGFHGGPTEYVQSYVRGKNVHRKSRKSRQHELAFKPWGGARRGAGRKRSGLRARVSHDARPQHCASHPLHLTMRLRPELPNLRRKDARNAIAEAFHSGRDRFGFRLTQFSLQSNHLHLIAEAGDRRALSRGMQGLLVRIARALNALWKRRGSVFADRFHARALRSPCEVRAALVYVLQNARHHGIRLLGIDPFSSGAWFDGWRAKLALAADLPPILAPPRTWLLVEGWLRHGRIGLEEFPARSEAAASSTAPLP